MKKKICYFISSLFNVGFLPKAPGTYGSLFSFIFIVPISYYFGVSGIVLFSAFCFLLGCFTSNEVLKHTEHDPGFIVIDETVGQTISFVFIGEFLKYNTSAWLFYVLGFILFRFFDITKPFLIGIADKKIRNAFGVMLDDVIAGIFAGLTLYLVYLIF